MKLFKYSFLELINNKGFCFLFILNLGLGLAGFVALDGFKGSIENTIHKRSKAVLGADFGLSARRALTKAEVSIVESHLPNNYQETKMVEMVSMVANKDKSSRLVQLKAIQEHYPFYGEVLLEGGTQLEVKKYQNRPVVWIYPELVRQLNTGKGESLKIGDQFFEVVGVIADDAAAGITTNMAPRIYLPFEQLQKTNLLKKGSIAWFSQLYRLPGLNDSELNDLKDKIFDKFEEAEIRVFTHKNASRQMAELLSRLNDFLGLASMVALFLASIGAAFLFRSYLQKSRTSIAILMSLGASRLQTFFFYLLQVILLGFLSCVLSVVLSFIIVPGLGGLTQELLPFDIQYELSLNTIFVALVVSLLGSVLIALPLLVRLRNIKISMLVRDQQARAHGFDPLFILSLLPAIVFFYIMSFWLSNSFQVGSIFTILFFVSCLVLSGLSLLLFAGLEKFMDIKNLSLRWAIRDLSRLRGTTVVTFVTIGLSSLLLNLIPQVQKTLGTELERPDQSKLPSLFLFDIQEEQVEPLENILKNHNLVLDQISPTIRARLVEINGEVFDKGKGIGKSLTREEEREMRFRNRGFNLSYRSQPSDAETIIEGSPFPGPFNEQRDKIPQISVETRFADRLNFKINDVLKFEIEGVPVEGKIVNLRRVEWTSFQPNFFVQFQPGVLEVAPKTFIATIPNMDIEKKHRLQDSLVEELPNVSLVDVSRIVKRINEVIVQMSWALGFMTILSLLSGFVVIYSMANHQARDRTWEIGLMKSLGAQFHLIRNQFLWQFCLVSFFAMFIGALLSLIMSWIFSSYIFESLWVFAWEIPLLSILFAVFGTLIVTTLAIRKSLEKPTSHLFS